MLEYTAERCGKLSFGQTNSKAGLDLGWEVDLKRQCHGAREDTARALLKACRFSQEPVVNSQFPRVHCPVVQAQGALKWLPLDL